MGRAAFGMVCALALLFGLIEGVALPKTKQSPADIPSYYAYVSSYPHGMTSFECRRRDLKR